MRRRVGGGDNAAKERHRAGRKPHEPARHRRHAAAGREDDRDRLNRELAEAHEREAAVSEVLSIISRSPTDDQTVFDAIVNRASRLCDAEFSAVARFDGEMLHLVAVNNMSAEETAAYHSLFPRPLDRGFVMGRAFLEGAPVQVEDVTVDPEYDPRTLSVMQRSGSDYRSYLAIPIGRPGAPIGAIGLGRRKVLPFTEREIELVETFADQAVIAIENARMFAEVEARERELELRTGELTEALQQQTATADVLKVISRSAFDLETVLQALVDSALRLCGATRGHVFAYDGELLRVAAAAGAWPGFIEYLRDHPPRIGPGSVSGRAAAERRIVHVRDVLSEPDYEYRGLVRQQGYRTVLAVPMLRDEALLGVIMLLKSRIEPFTERQIELVETFADQAVIAIENARLMDELQQRTRDVTEALEYQTAITDVLEIISRSPTDVQPVFDAIVQCASRLCDAEFSAVARFDGEMLRLAAVSNMSPQETAAYHRVFPRPPTRGFIMGRAFLESAPVQVEDVTTDPDYDPRTLEILQRAAPYRSYLGIPIGRPGAPIGAIGLGRRRVLPFTERQIELVTTFADQAVIAIENARLFDEVQARTKELTEALERQTATGEVLGVISRSPTDLQPVLDTIVATAARLCRAEWANIRKLEPDGKYHLAAATGNDQEFLRYLAQNPVVAGRGTMTGRTALEGRTLHIPDVLQDPEFTWSEVQAKGGHRTLLGVPLLRGGAAIGVIILARNVVRPFKEKEIELVTTFADQAVIAIENVRLFEEIEARTEELRKALEQQVATGEILRVIASSPTDIAPVLNAVAESAARLCGAADAQIFRVEDDSLRLAASFGSIPIHFRERAIGRDWVTGRAVVDRLTIHVPDLAAVSEAEFPTGREMQRRHGHRTTLATPLLRQGVALGAILIRRMDVNPFTEDQIRLLEAFADQAVIAIENVRLFTQLETRNAELNEALEQQTATAEVLKVISRYAFDLETVLRALLDSAIRLCGATRGHVFTCDGEFLRLAVAAGASPGFIEYIRDHPLRIGPGSAAGRAAAERRTTQIDDILVEPGYEYRNVMDEEGYRTVLAVPLLRNEALLGVIAILKPRVEPFTARQIELVATFADQAVIAIENARLLRELRESLEQQTATADVLKAISRATFDLPTVLKTLVEAAARLCEADQGTIAREQNGIYRRVASYGFSDQFNELISTLPVERGRGSATGRALAEGRVVHIPDVQSDPDYTFIEAKKLGGFRTILAVPMLREDVAIGVLALTRSRVCPFTEKEIELVATFADQAAIAIENVRLFESVEARTRELAESLEDLRTAQDRLVQTEKLASLGQLTAGIAHEIKNPLNFVNNFAGVSTELIEELREALAGVQLEDKAAEDVTELSQMLRGNLDKIVEHGKRADSIVKNMLLHARQGSGEHRRVDINAIVEESLNLAYHGARAERRGFNIALERSFDPTAGEVDVYPQEITRVLLNLISNGFYATLKRKAGDDDRHYEPTLKAATKNLGDRVEITIRDNGTGIPPEVREQLFRPFFTTKPVGEGTGLGLSISHDIVVKQHAGSIALDTRPGEFTEFSIVLPRDAASLAGGAPA